MGETRQRLVLVADDEPHIGRIIQMKLEQGPFAVNLAYDGAEAVDALDRGPLPDIVLLDLMMPRLSGLDVLNHIRSTPRLAHIPCAVLTAAGQEQQHRQAMELGADEFIAKPFSPKKLYQLVASLTGVEEGGGTARHTLADRPGSGPT